MRSYLPLTLLVIGVACSCIAAMNFGKHLPKTATPDEEDLQALYDLYLVNMAGTPWITNTQERYALFKANVLAVLGHNNNAAMTFQRTINQYTGMFWNELIGTAVMDNQNCSANIGSTRTITLGSGKTNPTSFDWAASGVITPVKDQKQCGSGWAFATTGAVESFWALYTHIAPVLLSEQQLIDCAQSFGNQGCEGGLPANAFEYITFNKGIDTENAYPYEAMDDTCRYSPETIGAMVFNGATNITSGDEESIMNALTTTGPISIAFQVQADFLSYSSGVYSSAACNATAATVNHAALITGYGTDPATGMDYWLVKNSWGSTWGEAGYFQIQRGVNMCGIAECASYPSMTDASPLGFLSL